MRIPATPPDWLQILAQMSEAEMTSAVRAVQEMEEYPHWDELRLMDPPEGASAEQVWATLKLRRRARDLPLRDSSGQPFTYSLADEGLEIANEIAMSTGGRLGASEVIVSSSDRDRYLLSSLREEAISSSQLEGAATTRDVAKKMLLEQRRPRTIGEQMITNNFEAMEWIRERQTAEITPDGIRNLHAILTHNTIDSHNVGRVQRPTEPRVGVFAGGEQIHTPPPAHTLPERLNQLCAFANQETNPAGWLHPLWRAILLHFMAGYDHYFVDGNGRLARALFYWQCLREGFWLMEYVSISRVLREAPGSYARAYLATETDEGDTTYFLLHQLRTIRRALDELDAYLARKKRESTQIASSMGQYDLNHRQTAVVQALMKDPNLQLTAKSHANSHGVSLQTARADLRHLTSLGLLSVSRQGRREVWRRGPSVGD